MAIALVTNVGAQGTTAGVTSAGVDTTGASLLVLTVGYFSGNAAPSISDSKGNTWVGLTARTVSSDQVVRLFYVVNPMVGSAHTFTAAGADTYASLAMQAFSSVATTSPFDQQNGATGTAITSLQPGSVTPPEDNEVLVTGLNSKAAAANATINSSFTITNQANIIAGTSYGYAMAYLVQTTAAAVNPTWSWTGSETAAVAIATFKAVPVGGTKLLLRLQTDGLFVGTR